VKLEVLESYAQGDATEESTQNLGQVSGATATASAPSSSSSGAGPAPGIEGAITRGRAARIRGESFHARKRRAGFDPEDIPYGKMPCLNGASPSAAHLVDGLHPAAMAMGGSFEDKVFQKLFFRSLTFLSLEELRALAQSAPLPIFVKDEQGAYLLANPAFCSFIYDDSWDAIAHRSAEDLLEAEESEPIHRADEYIKAREGNIGTFYLSVRNQDYKVMKLYTKLRDCEHKLVVGAVTF
jgi:PAS domain-containing protein